MEEKEVCGIRVKMPHINFQKLSNYESFLHNENPKRKLQFLSKTLFNTKHIKKTLDLRKLAELERVNALKSWKDVPERMVKQRINI